MNTKTSLLLMSMMFLGSTIFGDSFAVPPHERVTILSDTKILDKNGNEIDSISVDQQILIATPSFTTHFPLSIHFGCGKTIVDGDQIRCVGHTPSQQHVEGVQLIGESRFEQHAVSITQILDADGFVVHLSWVEGVLATDHVISPTVSWTPQESGVYTITTFFWESIGNPTALGPPSHIEVNIEQSLPPCTSDRTACFNRDVNLCDPKGWDCGDTDEIFTEIIK